MSLTVKESVMACSPFSVRFVAAALLAFGAAGCVTAGVGQAPTTAPSVVASTSAPTVAPTMAPTEAPTATPSEPTLTLDPPPASLGEPPVATLGAEGGDAVAGSLGSFTWGDGGSDSPWLPGAPISVGAGESLTVTLPADAPVERWLAKRVAAGSLDGAGALSLGNGAGAPITFRAPAPGAWSVQVDVTFGHDLGAATYYWAVSVR
jgi:hypothetical protein